MTEKQKEVIRLILDGGYLLKTRKHNRQIVYRLYDASASPIKNVSLRTVDNMSRRMDPDIKIWKRDKNGRMRLSPSGILKLRKNHWLKKTYKASRKKHPGRLKQNARIEQTL